MESGYLLFYFSEQPNPIKKTDERNNRIAILVRGISKVISLLVFLVLLTGNANAVPPSHYSTCSYYGYYPYSHGSYDAAIACADNWVENGWRRCPSCKLTHFYSLAGHPWPYNGGLIRIYVCAGGMLPDSSSNECVSEVYMLVVPDDVPPAQHCVGNPISVAGGIKHQHEIDIPINKKGGANVARHYRAGYGKHYGEWLINYHPVDRCDQA